MIKTFAICSLSDSIEEFYLRKKVSLEEVQAKISLKNATRSKVQNFTGAKSEC